MVRHGIMEAHGTGDGGHESEYVYRFTVVPSGTRVSVGEEIIRCRDCRHYRIVDEVHYMDGDGWDDIPVYGCTHLALAHARIDDDMQEPQDPDGFCAWGERANKQPVEVWQPASPEDVTCHE